MNGWVPPDPKGSKEYFGVDRTGDAVRFTRTMRRVSLPKRLRSFAIACRYDVWRNIRIAWDDAKYEPEQ